MTDDLKNLKEYKYNCVDKSILNNYIMNHYYNRAINIVPLSIAPNLLTLMGLFCSMFSAFLTIYTDPHLNDQKYPIVKLINAILLFMYQTFDALDGKQARRLNASTPLGQLFDHGCDALVCFFTSISLCSSLGLGANNDLIRIVFSLVSVYFLCTIEEYYTDMFSLGYINGPSEGIFAGIIAHLLSYFYGTQIFSFLQIIVFEKGRITAFTFFTICFIAVSVLSTIITIIRNKKRGTFGELINELSNIQCLFMAILIFNMNVIFRSLPLFYCLLFIFMFIFAKYNLELAYAHLKGSNIEKPDLNFYFFIIAGPLSLFIGFNNLSIIFLLFTSSFCYMSSVFSIITEICVYLRIRCFYVGKPKKE